MHKLYNLSVFVPAYQFITDISQAWNAIVTFADAHTYTPGEILSFRVSPPYGMIQINNMTGLVLSITEFTVTMNIDSLLFSPFTTPDTVVAYPAMVVPAGSGIIPGSKPATMNLKDAFDNVRVNCWLL